MGRGVSKPAAWMPRLIVESRRKRSKPSFASADDCAVDKCVLHRADASNWRGTAVGSDPDNRKGKDWNSVAETFVRYARGPVVRRIDAPRPKEAAGLDARWAKYVAYPIRECESGVKCMRIGGLGCYALDAACLEPLAEPSFGIPGCGKAPVNERSRCR